jgi:hypothetical protein
MASKEDSKSRRKVQHIRTLFDNCHNLKYDTLTDPLLHRNDFTMATYIGENPTQ